MNFASDNTAGAAPEIIDAIVRANTGADTSYGADRISARLNQKFSALFEKEVTVFPVATGTAANALALASITPQHGAIFCHQGAHINVDECGAPEFYAGTKLVAVASADGKLTPGAIRAALRHFQRNVVHHVQPWTISLSQATELGTVYSRSELGHLSDCARAEHLLIHMDGARFANAVASTKCTPAELTWKAGIDVLSFGATKNGALAAEAAIFFDRKHEGYFPYLRKRGGHLFSKMRFVSAQLEAMLDNDLWLRLASHANAMASRLEEGLRNVAAVKVDQPVEANEVFIALPSHQARRALEAKGAIFLLWSPTEDEVPLIRLVCSFATTPQEVDAFLAALRQSV